MKRTPPLYRAMPDVVASYGLSRGAIYRLVHAGRLEAKHLPGLRHVFITQQSLDQLMQSTVPLKVSDSVLGRPS